MTAIDEAREQLRARKVVPAALPWAPPVLADFLPDRYVMAFDATLTNCGWVIFAVVLGRIMVLARGTIRPVTGETGYMATWDKARQLKYEIDLAIGRWTPPGGYRCDIVVEAPAVKGNRIESSLIAGLLVWMDRPGCSVVSATHVSAVMLGEARMPSAERKKAVRRTVIRLCPEAVGRDWNEHERDALITGLTHLHDERGKAS